MTSATRLLLGTRGSALARWQADWVAGQLTAAGVAVELVPITTQGDLLQRDPLAVIASTGLFTKELQRALLDRRIDLAVHSLKDLPTETPDELILSAVPEREVIHDVVIARQGQQLADLPAGALIGTGSLRRRAQLLHAYPNLEMRDIRGNVDTRLRKLHEGQYDAIVLAQAGLKRLKLTEHISEVLSPSLMLPAPGQGALGIETRLDDATTRAAVATLDHGPTHCGVLAERSLLSALRGGCLAPIAAWGRLQADRQLLLEAVVLSGDGRQRLAASGTTVLDGNSHVRAIELGRQVAEELLTQGAAGLIAAARAT